MSQGEAHVRASQGHSHELCHDMLELDVVRLEELTSCRNIVEKVAYREVGASRCSYLLSSKVLRISKIHLTSDLVSVSAGLECHFCHSCNRSKGFAAETECKDVLEVVSCMELGCGMTLEAEHRLVRRHSAAVVDDLDQGTSGILNLHGHLVGTSVNGILHEFLDHGCRSLHDLSRGYHVGYIAW